MDLTKAEAVCLDIANGKTVTKRRARIAVVEIHTALTAYPHGPTPGQTRYLEVFVRLYDEADGTPPTGQEVSLAIGRSYTSTRTALEALLAKKLLADSEGKGKWRRYQPTELGRSHLK